MPQISEVVFIDFSILLEDVQNFSPSWALVRMGNSNKASSLGDPNERISIIVSGFIRTQIENEYDLMIPTVLRKLIADILRQIMVYPEIPSMNLS